MAPHLFIVHFPVALILVGVLADLAGTALADRALRMRAGQLIIIGGVAAFLGFVTGEGAKILAISTTQVDVARIATHEQWGSVGAWALLGVALSRTMWRGRLEGGIGWVNVLIGVAGAAIVIGITLSGSLVRHGM